MVEYPHQVWASWAWVVRYKKRQSITVQRQEKACVFILYSIDWMQTKKSLGLELQKLSKISVTYPLQTMNQEMIMPTLNQSQEQTEEQNAESAFFSDYEALTGVSPLIFESFDAALEALEGLS